MPKLRESNTKYAVQFTYPSIAEAIGVNVRTVHRDRESGKLQPEDLVAFCRYVLRKYKRKQRKLVDSPAHATP